MRAARQPGRAAARIKQAAARRAIWRLQADEMRREQAALRPPTPPRTPTRKA